MNKVLIADNVSDAVFKVFDENNIEYVQKTGLSEDELSREIVDYAGLVIRSAVTVTDKIISSAKNLRVIGCLLYTSPSPRDISGSRMPSSA